MPVFIESEGLRTLIDITGVKLIWLKLILILFLLLTGGAPLGSYYGGMHAVSNAVYTKVAKICVETDSLKVALVLEEEQVSDVKKALYIIADQNMLIANKLGIEGFPNMRLILNGG